MEPHPQEAEASANGRRARMVREQIEARGIHDPAVLEAMRRVPREAFLPPELVEFAYMDAPLPIDEGQTISQPYIVALMTAALELRPQDRVLEIGTGSGYAAAVLACVAREVYTVERHEALSDAARQRLARLGFHEVSVLHGDGTRGWREHAPYDGIVVTAGGPAVPSALLEQLAPGGRLVIPIGEDRTMQRLVRITRQPNGEFREDDLGDVRFVPLIGAEGWLDEAWNGEPMRPAPPATVAPLLKEVAEPLDLAAPEWGPLLDRIGDARLVLIGEATHGTSEFYALRAAITRALIARGFTIVAVEADWPDAARVNSWVQGRTPEPAMLRWQPFARFPTWMWRNHEVGAFVEWLREWNAGTTEKAVGFYGLDLYSLYTSIRVILDYLDREDPLTARIARERYGCLTPWEGHPAVYGQAAVTGRYRACEREAVAMLRNLLRRRIDFSTQEGERYFDAVQNARLVANAERYYRVMYYGGEASWNLRDRHMFETLQALLDFHGAGSRAVVWAHNSHLGNARATEMSVRGELNVGQLCRDAYAEAAYLVGFGTDHGTVAAARDWDGPLQVMPVRPAFPDSYEGVCHTADVPAFLLPLRAPRRPVIREELAAARLERAIGVVYRPETERQSHYFHAVLPHQFDEWIWIDETRAVHPLSERDSLRLPLAHPFTGHGHG